jgi:DNA-binding MarR family transcriptional regulator/GNAT superfamily N-acetyltransferase
MDDATVAAVRRFNRTVTARVGALNDRFLGLGRPLGEARALWEIGPDGCELRALRSRLGLDSGYASRLLRSLEAAGLVTVEPNDHDRRTRVARLTRAGLAERQQLDDRSEDFARSLVEPLTGVQREELVSSMRRVERLLTAAVVELKQVDPTHPDAVWCLESYFAELDRRSDGGFDRAVSTGAEPYDLRPPAGLMLLAYLGAEPIACGGVKHGAGAPAEIKRMWVADSARGLGLGRRMLAELEGRAAEHGARQVRLDTSRHLVEAISLYGSVGYREVAPFSDEPFADHWFEKTL